MRPYVIKKGNHSSGFHFAPLINPTEMKCSVMFTRSCLYDLGDADQEDINKLIGFSRGHHHHHSVRVGWNCKDDKIRLYAYVYDTGKRKTEYIGDVGIDIPINIHIKLLNGKYLIKVLGKELTKSVSIPINTPTSFSSVFGYKLFPYFGGDKPAPKKTIIWLS